MKQRDSEEQIIKFLKEADAEGSLSTPTSHLSMAGCSTSASNEHWFVFLAQRIFVIRPTPAKRSKVVGKRQHI